MGTSIDWTLAERVAARIAGDEPFYASYHADDFGAELEELTAVAQPRVEAETGFRSQSGAARAKVVDRADWVRANLASYQRMLKPVLSRLDELDGPAAAISGRIAGAELGALLGWMSTRVLGQYDLLVLEEEDPEDQDLVYYVGPNILALEKRQSFPPREFRLWVALHEVTHRTQFTGVPWLRPHFLGLVGELIDATDPDPTRVLTAAGRIAEGVRTWTNPLDEGGIAALFATPEQRATMEQVGGLMSLLEGHGDVVMDRAATDLVPSAPRFARVLRARRREMNLPTRLLQRLIGLDAKLAQYEQGEAFIAAVEAEGGPQLLNRAFERPELLPSMAEIRSPRLWLERVGPGATAA